MLKLTGTTEYERTILDPGVYGGVLAKVELGTIPPGQYNAEPRPGVRWVFDVLLEGDDAVRLSLITSLPKIVDGGLAFNEKAKFWQIISALVGLPLPNVAQSTEVALPVQTVEELFKAPPFWGGDGAQEHHEVDVRYAGAPLVGRAVVLTVGVREKDGKRYNSIDGVAPMPKAKKPATAKQGGSQEEASPW